VPRAPPSRDRIPCTDGFEKLKLGVSTWSLLSLDVTSAVRAIGDAGFGYVELWGEVPHAYPDWVNGARLRDALSSYKMDLTMHAPFTDLNPASPFQPVKAAVEKTLEHFVDFGASLGARIVTVHPGSVHNEAMVPQSSQNAVSTLKKMVKTADGRLDVNVENQVRSRSKYHLPLASTVESLELILGEEERLNFTLDTGHAHANGQDPHLLLQRTGPRLTEVHLHDNAGMTDEHLVPGEGTANLDQVLRSLDGSDVYVCIELDPYRYSPERAVNASLSLKARM
jgi:sugar phosphate isomerase/epimerase